LIIPNNKVKETPTSNNGSIKIITTLNGRTSGVWKDAFNLFLKNPLFGYGFGAERYLLKNYKGEPGSVDSTILNCLIQSGIVGTILFLASISSFLIMGYKLASGNTSIAILECVSVGVFILIRGITQSFSLYSADWLFLVPLIGYIQSLSLNH
jgi:O-antigen ligase